jgi:hypothetical protein
MSIVESSSHRCKYKPENCRWRIVIARDGIETAQCRFLQQLFGSERDDLCTVTNDVCTACCDTFPPTFEVLNPVVASLVFDRTQRLADVPTNRSSKQRWVSLRNWAEQHLEIDAPPLPELVLDHSKSFNSETARPLIELLPAPGVRSGEAVKHWAVGVTTAPRRRSHLNECLDSLAKAGWPRPHLFIDGAAMVPSDWSFLPATSRDEQVGAWPNFYLSLLEMLMREPLADAYLLVQDDALFYCRENVRQYLETVLWPGETPGIVSLYCATPVTREKPGWYKYAGRWKYSAVAVIFPREVARQLVIARSVFNHRWLDAEAGRVGVPDVIAAWAEATSTPFYFPTPSLVQHIGETSAIWLGAYKLTPWRRAGWLAGEDVVATAQISANSPRHGNAVEFPESAFPCPAEYEAEFLRRVDAGQLRMAATSAVICGLARNVASHLPATIARIERLAAMFRVCGIVVFENDSIDGTSELLADWAATNPAVRIISEQLGQPSICHGTSRERTERMAYYRNRCRERVLAEYSDCEFCLVADMDLDGGWSYTGIANTFGFEAWDFVGSHGLSARQSCAPQSLEFMDIFAFRAVGQARHLAQPHPFTYRRGEPFVPVWSCFGGLGIYRTECFNVASYEGDDCEHVTFHRTLRLRGFDRLYLNPSQIVLYTSWSDVA